MQKEEEEEEEVIVSKPVSESEILFSFHLLLIFFLFETKRNRTI